MKNKKILVVVAVVALLVIGYFVYQKMNFVSTDDAQIEAHSVLLAPKVSGYVVKVNVVEGQKVKKSDILLELDDRDYQNAFRQAKADLASIDARRRDAERNFQRISELYKKDAVSQQQFDQATTAFNDIKSKHEAAQAQVSQSELNVEHTKIVAPVAGFIAKRSVEVGQLAAPGVPVIGFVDAEERWVIANFKETDLADIHVGAKVDVSVDAVGGHVYQGVVESVSSATGATFTLLPPDNATGNFTKIVQRVPVRIKLQNLSAEEIELLKAGLSADISVHKH
jgi:membrane fusion protein (multidrug efflux system)